MSPYAAPARAIDLSGLPLTYVEVGQLDIFVYEDIEYARRIFPGGRNGGVSSSFRVLMDSKTLRRRYVFRIERYKIELGLSRVFDRICSVPIA